MSYRLAILLVALGACTGPQLQPHDNGDCSVTEFACDDGTTCIDRHLLCNGADNCAGGEDEKNCTKACSADQYQCQDQRCIERTQLCDGVDDCASREDEDGCGGSGSSTCAMGDFDCGDGSCIPSANKCDGASDCPSGADEEDCG